MRNKHTLAFYGTTLWSLVFLADAYAYLDPGTGGFILQLLVGIHWGHAGF